tara:strand:+ start:1114 stop:1374 length:261 start_codon:yes stop_codon:yes gene_type:complete
MIVLQGTQAAVGQNTGAASDFGGASAVRLLNITNTAQLITLEQADGTDIGTFTLYGGSSEILKKSPTDKLFAAGAGIVGVAVGFSH